MKKLITTLFLVLLSNYSQGQESYSLTVNVFDLRNSNGNILFLLYNKDGTIPDEKIKNYYKKEVGTISMNSSTITFNNCMSFYLPQVITANATLSKSLCLKYLRFNL